MKKIWEKKHEQESLEALERKRERSYLNRGFSRKKKNHGSLEREKLERKSLEAKSLEVKQIFDEINNEKTPDLDKNCSGQICVKENQIERNSQIETNSQINKIPVSNKTSQNENKISSKIPNQIRKINEKLSKKVGISLIALVITIIIIIILAAIVMMSSVNTVDSASYAKFAHEISEIQTSTDARRAKNAINGPGEENHNKGFTKVAIDNPPDSFVSFDEDAITGYWVDLDFIEMKDIKTGREELTEKRVTFGREDVYVYDYEGKVYYAKGYPDDDGRIHYKVDEVGSNTGIVTQPTISKIEYEISADKQSAIVTIVAEAINGGALTVTGGGKTASKTGENTYQLVINQNGTIYISVKESDGGRTTQSITISGIEVKVEYTISYNANGGTGAPSSHKVKEGETTQISNSKPNREGYTFKGWATSQTNANNGNVTYNGGESYVGNGNLTLYAVWEVITIEVSSLSISSVENQTYTGSAIEPKPTVKDGAKTLTLNTHYTLSYSNNTNAGTATITVTGKGNYVGSQTITFEIVKANMSGIKVIEYEAEYDGESHGITVNLSGTSAGATVKYGTTSGSYTQTVSPRYTEVGIYTIYFEVSKENYNSETGSATVKITAITMDTSGSVEASKRITISSVANQEYTGREIRPEPTVKYGSKTLTKDTDYTFGYSNNINVGTATITVTGKGNYAGTVSTTFEIINVTMTGISSEGFDGEYDGNAHGITVSLSGTSAGGSVKYGTSRGSYTQTTSPTYTEAGTYTVYYQVSKTNYESVEGEETVRITKRIMSDSESVDASKRITVSEIADKDYIGEEVKPEPVVKYGTTTLTLNKDYTLSYDNNTNVGTATITVTGTGNYSGTIDATFEIKLAAGTEFKVTLSEDTFTYDGTAKTPTVTVKTTVNNKEITLTSNDYDIAYSNNTNANSATNKPTITVTGKGNFAGVNKTVEFKIESQGMTRENTTIEVGTPEYTYDGTEKKPTVVVESNGKTLVEGTDYTVDYDNNTTAGEATVIITGIGNYEGTITESFIIVKADMTGISVTGYESVYDGLAHGITITGVTSGEDGVSIKYGTTQGTYDLTENPTYTDVGEYTVYYEITKPNYNTVIGSKTVKITEKEIAVAWNETILTYNGTEQAPTVGTDNTLNGVNGETIKIEVEGAKEHVGTDYEAKAKIVSVTNSDGTNGKVTNYKLTSETETITFEIIVNTGITLDIALVNPAQTYIYNGQEHKPEVIVSANGVELDPTNDYDVNYDNNIEAGENTARVRVTGKGDYDGVSKNFIFTIERRGIVITVDPNQSKVYGEAEPKLTYTYTNVLEDEEPEFTGVLSREEGQEVGEYEILIGTLGFKDTDKFKSKNYNLVFVVENIMFEITEKDLNGMTATVEEGTWAYTGSEIKPKVTIVYNGENLVEDTDYTLGYENNTTPGIASITVTGKGNFKGTTSATFTIVNGDMTGIKVNGYTGEYDEAEHGITVELTETSVGATVKYGTTEGTYNLNASPVYTDVNTYTVYYEVSKENYNTVTGSSTVTITARGMDDSEETDASKRITVSEIADQTYTGTAITPEPTVKYGTKTLELNKDYTLNYANNTNVGIATITVTGKGNYLGTVETTFNITNATIIGSTSAGYTGTYDGQSYGITVTQGTTVTTATVKYGTVQGEYISDTTPIFKNAGTYTVYYKIEAANYTTVYGSETVTINKKSVTVAWSNLELEYTGSNLRPTATATGITGETINLTVTTDAVNVGTYQATAVIDTVTNGSKDNYTLTDTTTNFTIKATDAAFSVSLGTSTYEYDGTAHTPSVTVVANGKTLSSETDYDVAYSNNINYGTATVTVTGKGNYSQTATAGFSITKKTITVTPKENQSKYFGEAEPTLTYDYSGQVNGEEPEFTGVLERSTGSVAGTYKINVGTLALADKGKFLANNYTLVFNTTTVNFTIKAIPLDGSVETVTVKLGETSYEYTGTEITPSVVVTVGEDTLVEGTDYIVACTENVNVGTATVTITGLNNYTGEILQTFEITKADANKITLSSTEISFKYKGETQIVEVTRDGDGDINAFSMDTSIVTVNVEDNKIEITPLKDGNTTIIVSVLEGTNYKAPEDEVIKIDVGIEEITLTASKDMNPLIEENKNVETVGSNVFSNVKEEQTFYITNVKTYNVVLNTKNYIESNLDMCGNDANKTFAITISMNDGEEKDILSDVNHLELGKVNINSCPNLTYKIYNANALSDISQEQYIIVELTSDKGLIIEQKININKELAEASEIQTEVVAGKQLVPFDNNITSVDISQDSVFTAQFSVELIPDLYKEHQIMFSDKLPIGTNITLTNIIDIENPTYWYYKVNEEISSVYLEEFTEMGKTQNSNYIKNTGNDIIDNVFLVTVDFSQCDEEKLLLGDYTIKMLINGIGVKNITSSELEFVTKNRSIYSLQSVESVLVGEEFIVNYSVEQSLGIESKYENRERTLVITTPNNFPNDAELIVDNNIYYLNSNKQFIVPIENIQNNNYDVKMQIDFNSFSAEGTEYNIDIALWISATSNGEAPLLGEKIESISVLVKEKLRPSLMVSGTGSRMFSQGETINVNYEYIPVDNSWITIELQNKDENMTYQKVTDKLISVNGSSENTSGVFEVIANQGTNEITIILSDDIESGTYRFVFKVYDYLNRQLLEIPYNILIS